MLLLHAIEAVLHPTAPSRRRGAMPTMSPLGNQVDPRQSPMRYYCVPIITTRSMLACGQSPWMKVWPGLCPPRIWIQTVDLVGTVIGADLCSTVIRQMTSRGVLVVIGRDSDQAFRLAETLNFGSVAINLSPPTPPLEHLRLACGVSCTSRTFSNYIQGLYRLKFWK